MTENIASELKPKEKLDLLSALFKKAADARRSGEESGKNAQAAVNEALRQVKQLSRENKLTKSGKED